MRKKNIKNKMGKLYNKPEKRSKEIEVWFNDELVCVYDSMTAAARGCGVKVQNIYKAIKGYKTKLKGYEFKIKKEG
jgi:predicted DNA-binding protein YlxM (UPF0122 family)